MTDERILIPAADCSWPSFRHHRWGEPSFFWPYNGENTELLGFICRYDTPEGKQIVPFTLWSTPRAPDGIWQCRSWPTPRPLYGLDLLASHPDATAIICEGEKAADAAQQLFLLPDYVCITSPGGSNAAHKACWAILQSRNIRIWPDNDAAGRKYAHAVIEQLHPSNHISILAIPPDKPEGWDAADALAEGWYYA